MSSLFYWILAIYLLSVAAHEFVYKKYKKYVGFSEEIKRVNYFYNVNKLAWIVAWLPILNLYSAYLMSMELYVDYKLRKMIRKVADKLLKSHPDDPDILKLKEITFETNTEEDNQKDSK